jgi:hypothetical protein
MKSMTILDPHLSRTGNGWRGLGGLDIVDLFHRHCPHDSIYICSKS